MSSHGMPAGSHSLKLSAFKEYVYRYHPNVIFIQEAFAGCPIVRGEAPSLSGYIPFVHLARKGLISYVYSSVPHQFLRCSTHDDMTTFSR